MELSETIQISIITGLVLLALIIVLLRAYITQLESSLAEAREEIERLIYAFYECPEDSVPDILQDAFVKLDLKEK